MSAKFVSAILGPEMAAPILWAPRISAFFLQENLDVHKIDSSFWGGGVFWVWGGECRFYFYGRGDFSEFGRTPDYSSPEDPAVLKTLRRINSLSPY